jgi:small subunit ribosomal protein S1
VDLGGLEGLIHVSELSWGRVQNPSDILRVNDNVQAQVLHVSKEEGKIALSLKRLTENPWEILSKRLKGGEKLDAVISSIVKYGAFARLKEGIEGLIHISSMNFPEGCRRIDDFLYEGQAVRVSVLNIDAKKRRLGLRLEYCLGE